MSIQTETSTPIDEIQRRLFAVLGGADPAEISELVEQQLSVAERELAQIPVRAQGRGQEFVQHVAVQMQSLLEHLSQYRTWLVQVDEGLAGDNHDALVSAYEEAQTLFPGLVSALQQFSAAYASYGPFATPCSNAVSRLAEGVSAGQAPPETWTEYLTSLQQDFSKRREAVRAAALPGRSRAGACYQQVLDRLNTLQAQAPPAKEALGATLHELDQSILMAEQIERLMSGGVDGPTAIPATNVLHSVVSKGIAQELELSLVSGFLNDYFIIMDQFWEGFEQSLTRPVDSALVQEEIPRTLEHGDEHSAVLEVLDAAIKAGDRAGMTGALEKLVATAAQLEESREVFATAAQHQGSTLCPGCGRANPPENRSCEACGTAIPIPEGGIAAMSSTFNLMSGPALEETRQMVMTENVAKLFGACDDVAVGKISDEQFQAILKEAAAGLKDFAQELGEIADETGDESDMQPDMQKIWQEQHAPYMQELGLVFQDGIRDCERGLAEMAAYLGDRDDKHLVAGVRIVWEGLGVLHRAQLSMNSNLKMLEDVLEEGVEKGLLTQEG